MRRAATLSLSLATAALTTAGTLALVPPSVAAPRPPAPAAAPTAVPTATTGHGGLRWRRCPTEDAPTLQCATQRVPLDHDRPRGATIGIALARVPAAAPSARRIGTVFVNPGGPGGSGVGMAGSEFGPYLAARLDGRFHVVGFDPRGVAGSEPLQCFETNDELFDFVFAGLPVFPYLARQERPYFARNQAYARTCLAQRQRIRAHMSTADVARDLDLLRAAAGDRRLSYLGFSYGSYLGNTYANLFPRRVRALAIDSVLDPRAWAAGAHIVYDRTSAQEVLEQFFRLCDEAGPGACAFAVPGIPSEVRYERLAERLLRAPVVLETEDGPVTYSYDVLIAESVGAMYTPSAWPDLAQLLLELTEAAAGSPASAGAARDALLAALHGDRVEPAYDNGFDAYHGNHCADAQFPRAFPVWSAVSRYARAGSRSGPFWWWFDAPCATWPVAPDRYTGPWTARTSAPVLVVGTYYDPATDYGGAVASDRYLRNSRLLSYAGWGHVAYSDNECVTSAVDRYLLRGTLPARGTVCAANPNPFLAAGARARTSALESPVGLPPTWLLRD